MEKFIEFIAEILEVEPEELTAESVFREVPEMFDSMMGFSILCMLEDEYGKKVSVDTFLDCATVQDLFELTK